MALLLLPYPTGTTIGWGIYELMGGAFMAKLVSFPDQIFHVCPADSSKNRVWTLSL